MTTPMRSGIPTTYRSTNFRSRLEARWAAFFDLIGWSWTYEPIDADGYIPDFLIAGARPFFVEVGPCITTQDYIEKSQKADASWTLLGHSVLVAGVNPLPTLTQYNGRSITGYEAPGLSAGWLGEPYTGWEGCYNSPADLDWGPARWALCEHGIGITHTCGDWTNRPHCTCRESWPDARVARKHLERFWAEAGNAVQWRGRAA